MAVEIREVVLQARVDDEPSTQQDPKIDVSDLKRELNKPDTFIARRIQKLIPDAFIGGRPESRLHLEAFLSNVIAAT